MAGKRKLDTEESQHEDDVKEIKSDDKQQYVDEQTQQESITESEQEEDEQDEDNIESIVEPFTKDQIVNLLLEATQNHPDVVDLIRKVADEDPAHRKVFVHGLGWDTNSDTLTESFGQYGEIEDCKSVTDRSSGKSKGYAFILFKTRRGALNALREPQKKIGNRLTSCQLAATGPVPAPAPFQSQHPISEYTQRKIYVSNVSSEVDPQKLCAFFSKYGEIEEGPLGLDRVTGKPKGFCLFVFKSVQSAKKALEDPHVNFQGITLHLQQAIDGPKPIKSPFQKNNNKNPKYYHNTQRPSSHIMEPSASVGQSLNPAAVGQALTALLATTQGGGLGFNSLLGNLGIQGAYGNQGLQGGYGNQGSNVMVSYGNQHAGQGGGSSRPYGHIGGPPHFLNH